MKTKHKFFNQQSGFSLIEMLIVTTITVILVVAGTSLFISTLLGGGRANTSNLVKTNGDYALGQMEFMLRNAVSLLPTTLSDPSTACYQNMDRIRIRSFDRGETVFTLEDNQIASNSGIYLTSDQVEVDNLIFDCVQSTDTAVSTVRISFTVSVGQQGVDRASEVQEQTFSTTVTLRGN